MKKLVTILLLFIGFMGYSQTNGITYQAVIINTSGEQLPGVNNANAPLANKNICLKFSIIDQNSQFEYIETVQTTTDEFGMVNLVIGTGDQIGGYASSFANIIWNTNPKSLKVDLSTTGICSYYTEISNQPFTAVPFALYAVNSESAAALTALQATVAANATATTNALGLKEDAANKSTTTTLGTSDVLFPTQNAVKTYVDSQVATATIPDANATTKGKIQLAGDLGGTASLPTVPGLANKENAANKSTATTLGNSDVLFPTQNAVKTYVDSNITTVNASNTALQATVAANATAATNAIAAVQADVNQNEADGDAADVILQNNITTLQNTVTSNATATTAALALKEDTANKSTTTSLGTSDVLFPTQNAVKTYVDSQVASATIPDANATTKGKIQLAGDLGGTASMPTVPGLANKENAANKSTTTTLGNSDVLFPTQNAVKIYVDSNITTVNASNTALQATVTTNATAATNAIAAVQADVNQNEADSDAADVILQNNITTLQNTVSSNATTTTSALGLKEDAANKSTTTSLGTSDVLFPTQNAVKTYVDSNITTVNASNTALQATVTTNATATTTAIAAIQADVNQNEADGDAADVILQNNITTLQNTVTSNATATTNALGLKEDAANKSTTTSLGTSDVLFPTQNAVKTYVDNQISSATISDATTTAKGKLQLAGDLAGTAAAPTVPGLALKAPLASPTFTGTVTSPIYASTPQALTDAATIVWNPANGLNASVTLGGNRTLNFSSTPAVGSYGTLVVSQDATGGRTITLPSTSNKVLGSTSTTTIALSTAPNAKDILNFYYDGTNCYWNIGQGYGTAATVASTNLVSGVSGILPVANGGTGATTLTGLVKGNGTGAMTVAVDGTDYLSPTGSAANLTNFPTLNQNTTGNAATATTATSATNVSGTVAVANGGTGATSLTANNVLLGNGTSALQVVAPGTSGNVLTSNGTTWSSSAPAASGVPYTGATQAVNLGAYDLTVNGLTVGKGRKDVAGTAYQYNSAFGVSALGSFTGGTKNTALGFNALSSVTSTDQNIAIGAYAMGSTTDYFQQSVAVGNQSLLYNKGSFNTALGSGAISSQNLTSAATYLVGVGALALLNNSSGQNNTAIGSYALSTNTTGNNNTALGQGADVNSATLDNATAIGYNAKVSTSNSIQLGNTSVTNVKTSGTVTAGTVTYPNTHGTANQVLSTTGSGTLTWVTPVNSAASLSGTLAVANGGNGLNTTPANGQIDIGNGTGFTRTTLTAGTAITITNTAGAITITAAVRPTTDQFTATAAQTSFTVTQTPLNAKVWMFINGVRTNNSAYSISGTTVTYTPASNNNYALVAGDRIQFDYAY